VEGTGKLHMGKYKEVMNDWNYDASYVLMLISLPVLDFEKFKCLIFVAESIHVNSFLYQLLFS
jgi:hypothetical protein